MDALSTARGPILDGPKSMLSKSVFRIGEKSDSPDQAIEVPVRYSKATSLARPQSLKKVIASQVARPKILSESITASQSQAPRASQFNSQLLASGPSTAAGTSGIAGIEADVSAFTKYFVVQKKNEQDQDVEMEDGSGGEHRIEDADEDEGEYEEMEVDIESCTKAYRFGSTWVPLNEEDFETMPTKSGIEVLGFIKETGVNVARVERPSIAYSSVVSLNVTMKWEKCCTSGRIRTTTNRRLSSLPSFKLWNRWALSEFSDMSTGMAAIPDSGLPSRSTLTTKRDVSSACIGFRYDRLSEGEAFADVLLFVKASLCRGREKLLLPFLETAEKQIRKAD